MDKSEALHLAIHGEDIEMFLDLLHQPGVDLNFVNQNGETPLLASIRKCNHVMVKNLIEAGCDINFAANGIISLLHETLKQEKLDFRILHTLIQKGAYINAPNDYGITPPDEVVYRHNLEVTCLFLYYGAKVTISKEDNSDVCLLMITVFDEANCQKVLLNYCDDFSIVFDLVERGIDVNCLDEKVRCYLLYRTLEHKNAKMFIFIWGRIDYQLLIHSDDFCCPFLLQYIKKAKFSISEFLECFYLMLDSTIAQNLIDDILYYQKEPVVRILLKVLADREISPKDRLSAIYTCLSFGVVIEIVDLRYACKRYGLNEEFKALLYAGNFSCTDCIKAIKYCKKLKIDFYLKGFSSFSLDNERHTEDIREYRNIYSIAYYEKVLEALGEVPKFPSLFELARNKAQKFIQQNFHITKLYQFYDVVACLKLPQSIKDILLLEKAIYNYSVGTVIIDDDPDDEFEYDCDPNDDRNYDYDPDDELNYDYDPDDEFNYDYDPNEFNYDYDSNDEVECEHDPDYFD